SSLGRVSNLVDRPGGLRAAAMAGAVATRPGGRVLGRQHGLRPSRLLYMRRVGRPGRRAADHPLLVRLRTRPDAARARPRRPVHIPQLAPLPLSPGVLPPDGAAHRLAAARGVPADARAAAPRQPAREAGRLPGPGPEVAA